MSYAPRSTGLTQFSAAPSRRAGRARYQVNRQAMCRRRSACRTTGPCAAQLLQRSTAIRSRRAPPVAASCLPLPRGLPGARYRVRPTRRSRRRLARASGKVGDTVARDRQPIGIRDGLIATRCQSVLAVHKIHFKPRSAPCDHSLLKTAPASPVHVIPLAAHPVLRCSASSRPCGSSVMASVDVSRAAERLPGRFWTAM
jgi:hypothetical protein